jgi:protein-L-isoaspartate(D-aspartate) O-methyltransferase
MMKQNLKIAGLLCLLINTVSLAVATAGPRDRFREMRLKMVDEYIQREGIKNPRVLEAMRTVPRHEFVRPALRMRAYLDGTLPIGYKQTISPPFIVAYMTETIDPQPTDRVLEIGTGSGYQAAVLSGLAKEVYTIEIVAPLGRRAKTRLKRLGYQNVKTKVGDGYQGWSQHAPFDKIIVTCSPENVPKPLVEQLKEGGKMIIPLGQRYQQIFHLFEKQSGKLVQTKLIPTLFVPMTGISERQRKIKPDPLDPQVINSGFEDDVNQDGRPDNWHYQRQATIVKSEAPEGNRYIRFSNSDPGRLSQMLQGIALNGRIIGELRISLMVKFDQTAVGPEAYEKPALYVHFYDVSRRPMREGLLGPWIGSGEWRHWASTIKVPPKAREAIVRIGLNGGTGELCVDNIKISARRRSR